MTIITLSLPSTLVKEWKRECRKLNEAYSKRISNLLREDLNSLKKE